MSEISPNTPPAAAEPAVLHPQPAEPPPAAGPPEVVAPAPAEPPAAAEPAALNYHQQLSDFSHEFFNLAPDDDLSDLPPPPAGPPAGRDPGPAEPTLVDYPFEAVIAAVEAVMEEQGDSQLLAKAPPRLPKVTAPIPPLLSPPPKALPSPLPATIPLKAKFKAMARAPVAKVTAVPDCPPVSKANFCILTPAMVRPKVAPPPVSKANASMAKATATSSKSSAIAGPARGSVDWKAHDAAKKAVLGVGSAALRRWRKMASAEGAAKLKAKMRDRDDMRKRAKLHD